jgi:hypothetical protein
VKLWHGIAVVVAVVLIAALLSWAFGLNVFFWSSTHK